MNTDSVDWDDLRDDIRDQRCVLFIGPDVVQVNGQPLHQAVRNYLKEQCKPGEIIQDYQRDGFFLFKNPLAKTNARRLFNRFFVKHTIDESVFKRILEIPFHAVISINADTLLDDIAYKYGVPHRFHFFRCRNQPEEEIDYPSSVTPLFYNLCGCKSQDDSLLLDYEDLFQLLKSTLGTPGLPQKLKETLASARTFLFLGFQFDKWHTQLLIRLLQGERGDISSKVLGNYFPEEDTSSFLVNQFNLQFLGKESDFLDKLYKHCQEKNILRRLEKNPFSGDAVEIIRLVQTNQLDKALDILQTVANQNKNDEVELFASSLKSRWSKWDEDLEKGIIDNRDASVERNKIVDAILKSTKQLQHV
ncbi:MAG: SIR2 family protein [Adhaeribacter sp.]